MNRGKGAVITAVSSDTFFAAATLCMRFLELRCEFFKDFIIVVDDKSRLSEKDIEIITSLSTNVNKIIILNGQDILPQINIDNVNFSKFISYYTEMVLVKLFIPRLFGPARPACLQPYDKVLWLDSDTLPLENFDDIVLKDSLAVSACAGGKLGDVAGEYFWDFNLEMSTEDKQPNGGVILFSKQAFSKLLIDEHYDKFYCETMFRCIDFVSKKTWKMIDELSILIALKSLHITLSFIDSTFNYRATWPIRKVKIIHAIGGKSKFWNNPFINLRYREWQMAYNQWVSLGGGGLNVPPHNNCLCSSKDIFNDLVIKEQWRNFWGDIFGKIKYSNSHLWISMTIDSDKCRLGFKNPEIAKSSIITIQSKDNQFLLTLSIKKDQIGSLTLSKLIIFSKRCPHLKIFENSKFALIEFADSIAIKQLSECIDKLCNLAIFAHEI